VVDIVGMNVDLGGFLGGIEGYREEVWLLVERVGGGAEICVGAVSWGTNCGLEMGGAFVEETSSVEL
jgi:hypothetical protein